MYNMTYRTNIDNIVCYLYWNENFLKKNMDDDRSALN